MMNRKSLIKLGVVTLVAVVAAFAINRSRQPVSEFSHRATALVPGLDNHVNEVSRFVLTVAKGEKVVELVRGDKGWAVQERGGYPADVGKLRAYLLKLADASLIEQKTANPERHVDLGVEAVGDASAKGVEVRIEGLAEPVSFVAGNYNAQGGGTYVRRSDEAQSWLADGNLIPERSPADWLRKELADIPAQRIASVEITPAEGKPLRVAKVSEQDSSYTIADIPKGREPSSEFAANGLAGVLADLRFEDVAPTASVAAPESATRVRYRTFDGIIVDATVWTVDEKHYATFAASLDDARVDAYIAGQQAAAQSKSKEEAANPGADASKEPASEATADAAAPAAATAATTGQASGAAAAVDPAKDREQRLASIKAEVERLNAAFAGWSFALPAYKSANMTKGMSDLLKPLEDATAKKAAGTP
jgi:hypothetical protein